MRGRWFCPHGAANIQKVVFEVSCYTGLLRWTGGGAAERAGLENQYTFRCIVGSNPTLSVLGEQKGAMKQLDGLWD